MQNMTDIMDTVTDLARGASRIGGPDQVLSDDAVRQFVTQSLAAEDLDGRSVCVIVPDGTRSCPLPLLLSAVHEALTGRAAQVTVLIALGTHAAMSEAQLAAHLGYAAGRLEATYPGITVINHEWWKPETFTSAGPYQRRPGRRTVRRPVPPVGGGGPEPRGRRSRCVAGRRPGVPA